MAIFRFDKKPHLDFDPSSGNTHEISYNDEKLTITNVLRDADGGIKHKVTKYLSEAELAKLKTMGPAQFNDAILVYSSAAMSRQAVNANVTAAKVLERMKK